MYLAADSFFSSIRKDLVTLMRKSAFPIEEKITMRTRTGGKYCVAIVLGATKCAIPSRLRGRGVKVGLPTLLTGKRCHSKVRKPLPVR